jgi:hypothetical protein
MDLLATLRETIGLAADANEAACIAAVAALKEKEATAAQAALAPIAKAAGLKEDAEATAILAAVTTLATADAAKAGDQVKALQSELATVAGTDVHSVSLVRLRLWISESNSNSVIWESLQPRGTSLFLTSVPDRRSPEVWRTRAKERTSGPKSR